MRLFQESKLTSNAAPELADAHRLGVLAPDRRVLLVTPKLTGMDGVSNVSRQVVDVIVHSNQYRPRLRIWSLADGTCSFRSIPIEGFSDAKVKLGIRALTDAFFAADDLTVFMLHLHLVPLALPIAARGGKLVTFLHGIECWKPLTLIQQTALRCSSLVIATSQYTKEQFTSCNPTLREQDIWVCQPGSESEPRAVNPDRKPSLFALIVGRMDAHERYKGHDLILEIWPRLKSEHLSARLVVVGDGTDLPRLRSKAVALGLGDAVEFLGKVTDECLRGLYSDCAFFVMPSRGEGFGLVFLEAMCAGKACIAAKGAAEEIIEHGVSGYVIDYSNPAELFECMKRLFCNSALRSQMGVAGLRRFRSHFTAAHFRQRLLSVLAQHEEQLCAE